MNKESIVEAVLQRIDRTWSGRLEPLYKLSTLLFTLLSQPRPKTSIAIISGTGKATDWQDCKFKIPGKVTVGVLRDSLENFQDTHI